MPSIGTKGSKDERKKLLSGGGDEDRIDIDDDEAALIDSKNANNANDKSADDYGATGKDGKKKKKEKKQRRRTRPLKDLFRYSNSTDVALLLFGSLVSLVTGAGWPFMSTIFGGMSNTFIGAQNSYSSWFTNGTNFSLGMTTTPAPAGFDQSQNDFHDNTMNYVMQYVYLGCAVLVAGYFQMACWITACERQILKIRMEFFNAILRQNIGWYDEHQSGEMTTKLSELKIKISFSFLFSCTMQNKNIIIRGNLERVKEGIGDKFGLLIQYIAQFFAGFIIAFTYSWQLTLVMMSLTPLLALSGAFMSRMIANSTRKEQEKYAVAGAIAEEVFSCVRTVITFNGQRQECDRYEKALDAGKRDGVMKSLYTGLGLGVTFMILFCAYALAFWYGSVLILSGDIERGTVFVVFFSVMMGSFALGNAAPQVSVIATAMGAATDILDIIDRVPEIDSYSKSGKKIQDPQGRIEFSKVAFNYPTRKNVKILDGIDFSVEPGETVALVGSSGCGKSTIVNLLLRYYDIDSGSITVDGCETSALNVRWLRNIIGVVSQEPVLFDASVEANIRMGRQNITYQEMVKACKMANAHDFISKLPEGYQTKVGERGTQMSGGQKQRIAIARALVRDPKILLLDEATSALDAESEGIVQEALDKAAQGRTTIIIAHRLSTIRNADKILALELGEVKEAGSHTELMNQKGLYYSLVTAQIFEEPASGYATATDGGVTKDDSDDSGTDVDTSQQKKRRLRRQKSARTASIGGGSSVSDASTSASRSTTARQRRMTRMLSRVETPKERMEREIKEEGAQQSNLVQIMTANSPEWMEITIGMCGAVVRGCVMPAFAFFYGEIFNAYSKSGEELKAAAEFWALMFIVIGVVQALSLLISTYYFGVSGETLTKRLRLQAFRNLLRQDVAYFDDPTHSTGKITTRLASDAPNIKAAVDFRLATVLSSVVSMVAGIVIAFIYGWQMALLTLALVPVIGFGGFLNVRIRTGNDQVDQKLLEEAGKVASEAIENPRTVQSLTKEKLFYDKFVKHLQLPYRHALKHAHLQAVSFAFAQSIFFFFYAVCFRFGGWLVERGDMDPISVYRVFFAVQFSGMTIGWATAYFPEFIKAKFAAGLIFKMINQEPLIDSYSPNGIKPELTGKVKFDDLYFSYPTREQVPVLRGLSLKIDQNQTLALVGQSGCGKSTMVSLMERFYDPQDGGIILDDFDVRTLNVAHLRSSLSLVSQEPVLFDCPIKDNITYGLHNIPHAKVVEAAKKANIHDFIIGLPEGYETRVGEKGTQLSGGQKQRVAIARALVREPKILLLDEATSALDTESEKIVQEALDRAREGRTCIIIAHRLSTVQSADTIAVVRNGQVVEQGSHAELVQRRGAYYMLTKNQNLA